MANSKTRGSRTIFSNERPAYPICPPAVVRHVLFRLQAQDSGDRSAVLHQCLTRHLNALRDAYGSGEGRVAIVHSAAEADANELHFSPNRSILFEIENAQVDHGYRFRVRADIYAELFTVTYLIDRIGDRGSSELADQIAQLPREEETADWLFDDFWESAAFPAAGEMHRWTMQRRRPECSREIGELIADFRTILLFPRPAWPMGEPSLEFSRIAISDESTVAPEILAFASEHQKLIRRVTGTHTDHAGGESVACSMAGGQALYAAELGQWGHSANAIQPIHLLLVYAGHSDAQLGRLMRRLHVLGELRHAAVLDWDLSYADTDRDLNHASDRLRVLSHRVDEATLHSSMDEIRDILPEFARISMWVDGGLSYRIERSRSYAESFLATMPHLRITRLAGWQPYDDFINRYISLLFGRIDRIGHQYEELGRRLDRLLYYEQATRLEDYQGTVSGTLRQLSALNVATKKNSDGQLRLLAKADLFAVVFTVYYMGSILEALLEKNEKTLPGLLGVSHELFEYITHGFLLLWTLIGAGMLFHLLRRDRKAGQVWDENEAVRREEARTED